MIKPFEEEIVPVMLGTKCSRCWVGIKTTLSNGKLIYFCEKCQLKSKVHPIGGRAKEENNLEKWVNYYID